MKKNAGSSVASLRWQGVSERVTGALRRLAGAVVLAVPVVAAQPVQAQVVFDSNADAMAMANELFGTGFTVNSATLLGRSPQSAIYTNGTAGSPGVSPADTGVIFSTAAAAKFSDYDGRNDNISQNMYGAGDPDLRALRRGRYYDRSGIVVSFTADVSGTANLPVTFLTEEYPGYYGSRFSDIGAFFLDGTALSITGASNNWIEVNDLSSPPPIVNPTASWYRPRTVFETDFNAGQSYTVPITVVAGQTYTFKMVIADRTDADVDSAFMVGGGALEIPVYPELAVAKSTNSVPQGVGDTLTYTFTVTNSGDTYATSVSVADPKCAAAPVYVSGDANLDGHLDTSETWVFSCTSVGVTSAEVTAGSVDNTVTVSYLDSDGGAMADVTDTISTPIVARTITADTDDLGSVSGYTGGTTTVNVLDGDMLDGVQVTTSTVNLTAISVPSPASGSLTLNADGTVTVAAGTTAGTYTINYQICETANPGNCATATATVVVTPPVVEAGNPTTVTMDGTNGGTTSSVLDNGTIGGDPAAGAVNFTWETPADPGITLNADGTVTVAPGTAPGSYTYTFKICDPVNPTVCDTSTITVDVFAQPKLALIKALDGTPARNQNSDQFTLTIAGTNGPASVTTTGTGSTATGTATLTGVVGQAYTLSESAAGTSDLANYTSSYSCSNVSTKSDKTVIPAGSGTSFVTPTLKADDDITCTFTNTYSNVANLETVKALASGDANPGDGDTVSYIITVTNQGPGDGTNISLNDALPAGLTQTGATASVGTYTSPTWTIPTLAAGSSATLTLTGTVDPNQGGQVITNTTTAASGDQDDPTTAQDVLSVSITVEEQPAISVVKASGAVADTNGDGVTNAGDQVTYSFTIQNDGNMPMNSYRLVDTKLNLDVTVPLATPLAPGGTVTFNASAYPYTLTQADMNAGVVYNQATGSIPGTAASDTSGTAPTNNTLTSTPLTQVASVSASKVLNSASPGNFDAVGDVLTYDVVVTNTGTVSLTGSITATDLVLGVDASNLTCPSITAGLAPGASVTCSSATYTVTQADIDTGSFQNTASVSVTDPNHTVANATSSLTVQAVQNRSLTLDKLHTNTGVSFASGSVLEYTLTVTNDGNVTMTGVDVADPDADAGTLLVQGTANPCTNQTIAPGATVVCEAQKTLNSADITAETFTNTAIVSAGGVIYATDSTTYNNGTKKLSLSKTVLSGNGFTAAGQTVTYQFAVTNSGTGTINSATDPLVIAVADPLLGGTPGNCTDTQAPTNSFASGQTITCTAAYTVTQADVDRGTINNTATASFNDPARTITSEPSSATATAGSVPAAALTVVKSATTTANTAGVGDTVTYSFTVTNTGGYTIKDVQPSDPKLSSLSCSETVDVNGTNANPAPLPFTLLPTEQLTCGGTYVLTQDDIDTQSAENTATASGVDPSGTVVSAQGNTTYDPEDGVGNLNLLKTGVFTDENGDGKAQAGETVTYTLTVENTGTYSLNNVVVSDPMFTPTTLATYATLAPGESQQVSGTWVITQAFLDSAASAVTNTATAQGTTPDLQTITDGSRPSDTTDATNAGTPTQVTLPRDPELTTTKTGTYQDTNGNGIADVGDVIAYTITVTNTGAVEITNMQASDSLLGGAIGGTYTLAPGQSVTLTQADDPALSYPITQANLNAGSVTNVATGAGQDNAGAAVTDDSPSVTTNLPEAPAIALVKAGTVQPGADGVMQVGDTIDYTFTVTNTGNVSLTGITITDPMIPGIPPIAGPIAPGQTGSVTVPYTIPDQATIDAGSVTNSATASGNSPAGTTVSDTSGTTNEDGTPTVTPIASVPDISTVKTAAVNAGADGIVNAGDTITYTFVIQNDGNTSLRNIALRDGKFTPDLIATLPGPLAPGATTTVTKDYVLTQADLDAGSVQNQGTVTAEDPQGTSVSDLSGTAQANDDPTVTPLPQTATVALVKSGTVNDANGSGRDDVGDTITYSFTATNTGAVSLRDITIEDPQLDPTTLGPIAGPVAPGDSVTITATYDITQANLNAGQADNTATVTATSPSGSTATNSATAQVPLTAAGALSATKSLSSTSPASYSTDGETLRYDIVVTNTGNANLLDPITIDDPLTSDETCPALPAGGLAPGASITCTATYATTQQDVDTGQVVNTATVTAGALTATDGNTTLADQKPALTVVKSTTHTGPLVPNDVLSYSYLVTNTGNTTLTGPFSVTDDRIASVSCPAGPLAPGATLTCTASSTVTLGDVELGSITNNAVGTANGVTSPNSTVTIPESSNPALTMDKSVKWVNGSTTAPVKRAGDVITYQFAVTNSGTGTFVRDVTVTDLRLSPSTFECWDQSESTPAFFAPGATHTCTATYTVTQADIDGGDTLRNEAKASSIFAPSSGSPIPVNSATDPVATPIEVKPSLRLAKSASPAFGAGVGDVITYTLIATNDGNQTIRNAAISDPMLGTLSCDKPAPVTLLPGAKLTCTGTHRVTQANVNDEAIQNDASASGINPAGQPVDATASLTYTPEAPSPTLSLQKTAQLLDANGNGVADAGEVLRYTLVTTNTGNQTLTNATVSDPLLSATPLATYASLAPGAVRSVTSDLVITQAKIDSGDAAYENTATASAQDPDGATVSDTDTVVTPLTRNASSTLDKVASYADTNGNGVRDAGDTITYTFTVTNTGTTTLSGLSINDPLLGGAVATGITLAPGGVHVETVSHTITQAEADDGKVVNTASTSATDSQGTTVTANDGTTTPLPSAAGLNLVKSGSLNDLNGNGRADVGDTITYTFAVTNTGNVSLRNTDVTDAKFSPTLVGSIAGPLAPGATATVTADYPITLADMDAGKAVNTATAEGSAPNGSKVSDISGTGAANDNPTTVPLPTVRKLAIDKNITSPASLTAAGQVVAYEFTVTNTGNVTSGAPLRVTDSLSALTITCSATALAPGASATCTFNYTATQDDIDQGSVKNTATVSDGIVTSTPDSATINAVQSPKSTMAKSTNWVSGTPFQPGQIVNYSYVVTNTGNTTQSGISVVDDRVPTIGCGTTTLAPGASTTCTGTYVVTVTDVALGRVTNLAYATDGTTKSNTDSVTVPLGVTPALTLTKVATETTYSAVNNTITYTYTVTNTGTTAFVADVTVRDDVLGDILCWDYSASGAFNTNAVATCTAVHTVVQDDLNRGFITNEATASTIFAPSGAALPVSSPTQKVTVPATLTSNLAVAKAATTPPGAPVGSVVTYQITATNGGNQTLTGVEISDPKIPNLTCTPAQPATLAPSAVLTCSGDYTLTQADINASQVLNTATALGAAPDGTAVTGTSLQHVYDPQDPAPELSVKKTGVLVDTNGNGLADPDEIARYTIVVTNTGNVTVNNIDVTDPAITPPTIASGVTLAPGASQSFVVDLPITQTQIDAGEATNQATASGLDPSSSPVSDLSSPDGTGAADSIVALPQNPDLGLVKEGTYQDANGDGVVNVGDVVDYTMTVTNTGNVTITAAQVSDPMLSPDPIATGLALNVGQSVTLTSATYPVLRYTLTQTDLDGLSITNEATATGTTATAGSTGPVLGKATTPLAPQPDIGLVKTAAYADSNENGLVDIGDQVTYTMVVTNTGALTLNDVAVTDPMLPVLTCTPAAPATLVPGAQQTCSGTYAITQADMDARKVENQATVNAKAPDGTPVSALSGTASDNTDPTVLPLQATPSFTVEKSHVFMDQNGNDLVNANDILRYSFRVTNTGTVSLSEIQLRDEMLDNPDVGVILGPLAPGGVAELSVDYVLSTADIDNEEVLNKVTAGVVYDGAVLRNSATDLAPTNTAPVAEPDRIDQQEPGTPVTLYPLANDSDPDGNALLPATMQILYDGLPSSADISPDGYTAVIPGEGTWKINPDTGALTFTPEPGFLDDPTPISYAMRDDNQALSNPARVVIDYIDPVRIPPVAQPDTVIVPEPSTPVTIDILANDSDEDGQIDPTKVQLVGAQGDGRTLVVEGQGTWTVNPETGALTFTPEDGFTGNPDPVSYTVWDDGRNVSNPAVVRVIYGEPKFEIRAEVAEFIDRDGDAKPSAGDQITYRFSVVNTGNLPLTDVTVLADLLPGLTCVPVALGVSSDQQARGIPGDDMPSTAELSCTNATYTLTDADIAAGSMTLTTRGLATDPSGKRFAAENEVVLEQPLQEPSGITITKRATGPSTYYQGDLVPYEIVVENLSPSLRADVTVVDILPQGLIYEKGSAAVNGTATTAVVDDRVIRFERIVLAPSGRAVITLRAFVPGSVKPGEYTNRAQALNPETGAMLAPEASATIVVGAEAVFDCSTVIGKVWDDRNGDGYQNAPDGRAITDQTYKGSKGALAPTAPGGEPGLPGVRLVTPNGVAITTDEHGRYSVPCAALPEAIGQNFLLKLDERTLPTGYHMTTENPRVMRLTAGTMTEMNFGARSTRVVDVALSARAFDGAQPRPELLDGLRRMVQTIARTPSVVVLTYQLAPGEAAGTGRAHLRRVSSLIRQYWPANGRYRLVIETSLQRLGARVSE